MMAINGRILVKSDQHLNNLVFLISAEAFKLEEVSK
jgi:hypothetical protein